MPDSPATPPADSAGSESTASAESTGLAWLNALSTPDFHTEFAACLNVDRWVAALAAERPFSSTAVLMAAADQHARTVTEDEVAAALARHPRIGERATGANTEASWSRGEQSGMATATTDIQEALRAGQATYERQFGHIYLVCASGLSSEDMVADLQSRLGNDPATEARVVAEELRKIALLRLEKLINGREE